MCNNIKKGLVILANAFICVIIVVFHLLTENMKKDRALMFEVKITIALQGRRCCVGAGG